MARKNRFNLTVNDEMKSKAEYLSTQTGYSISYIIELLLNDTSESEIIKLHKESVKKANK